MVEKKNYWRPRLVFIITLTGLILAMIISICIGAKNIELATIYDALFQYDATNSQHIIIRSLRIPRILVAAIVGASFAVSGAIMQGMTRNPMASPSILGINAGAAFGLAIAMAFFPNASFNRVILFSFAGAGLAAVFITTVGNLSKNGNGALRLALAGSAITALFNAFSQGLAVFFNISQDLAFWNAGGVAGMRWEQVQLILPWTIGGLLLALLISRAITILSLGEDISTALGEKTTATKVKGSITILILTGSAVAIVGPVGFVGLVIPHIARYLVGLDYKWIIPYSMIAGAFLVVVADILSRLVNPPFETPLGAITSLIGVPFFVYLATGKGGKKHV